MELDNTRRLVRLQRHAAAAKSPAAAAETAAATETAAAAKVKIAAAEFLDCLLVGPSWRYQFLI